MKNNASSRLFCALCALLGLSLAQTLVAKAEAGPQGGRLLTEATPRIEFFVNAARRIEVRLYDAALKPVPLCELKAVATLQSDKGKTRIELEPRDQVLVATQPLPEGAAGLFVLQVWETPGAKPRNFRIPALLNTCGGCQRAEYACTCEDHAH